ncbi:unnamed protein product [Boreogadus saida]
MQRTGGGGKNNKRRRESQHEDTDLPLVVDQIEEVILASRGLKDVSKTLQDLANFAQANRRTSISLSNSQAGGSCEGSICLYHMWRSYEGAHICQLLQNHPGLQQLCGAMAG